MAVPVICKFDEDPIKIEGTVDDQTRSDMGFLPLESPIWPEFELV